MTNHFAMNDKIMTKKTLLPVQITCGLRIARKVDTHACTHAGRQAGTHTNTHTDTQNTFVLPHKRPLRVPNSWIIVLKRCQWDLKWVKHSKTTVDRRPLADACTPSSP